MDCSVEGCDRDRHALELCLAHYKRLRKTGDPLGSARKSVETRFWEKVDKTDTCWLWTSTILGNGYGNFSVGGRDGSAIRAHRWAYQALVGPIPDGLDLDHLCRVRHCVNPDHLDPVTRSVNLSRGRPGKDARERAALITHCPHGHEYSAANTKLRPTEYGGWARKCRACAREYSQRKRAQVA